MYIYGLTPLPPTLDLESFGCIGFRVLQVSVASVFRVASFQRCMIFRFKALEFHVCGEFHCFDMVSSFHGFRRPVGFDFHCFLLLLTPFGSHLGSILASFWLHFEPWRPFGLNFGSILSPGGPLARSRGPLGRIWGAFGATLAPSFGAQGHLGVVWGAFWDVF